MKYLTWCIVLPWLAALSAEADTTAPTADDWYKNQYAPLYKENAWDVSDEFAKYFDETVYYHASDGTVSAEIAETWIANDIEEWRSDGWLGSDIAGYQSVLLNATTAVFTVKWRDRYADGNEEFECGWYMADLRDDDWIISQYADIDCAEHNL